jgi:hypothetical protein
VFSIAITTSAPVAVLVGHATAGSFFSAREARATTIISVMLVILAAVNTVRAAGGKRTVPAWERNCSFGPEQLARM